MRNKKTLILFLLSLFLTHTLSATSSLRIVGSSAVFPFAATVAEHLSYKSQVPAPLVESIGTGAGIKLFCENMKGADGAITSRPMTGKEKKKCHDKGIRFEEFKIGQDGLILIQSNQNPSFSLSLRMLANALLEIIPKDHACTKNAYKTWKDIRNTLPSFDIRVLGPAPTSGSYDVLLDKISGPCGALLRQDGAYIEAPANENLIVQKVLNAPHTIGIVTFSFYEKNKSRLHPLSLNGVLPTLTSIQKGDYSLSRPLFLYIKTNADKDFPLRKAYALEFTSRAAIGDKGYLTKKGLIPLSQDEQKTMHNRASSLKPRSAP